MTKRLRKLWRRLLIRHRAREIIRWKLGPAQTGLILARVSPNERWPFLWQRCNRNIERVYRVIRRQRPFSPVVR